MLTRPVLWNRINLDRLRHVSTLDFVSGIIVVCHPHRNDCKYSSLPNFRHHRHLFIIKQCFYLQHSTQKTSSKTSTHLKKIPILQRYSKDHPQRDQRPFGIKFFASSRSFPLTFPSARAQHVIANISSNPPPTPPSPPPPPSPRPPAPPPPPPRAAPPGSRRCSPPPRTARSPQSLLREEAATHPAQR